MNREQAFKVYGVLDDEGYRPRFKKFGKNYDVDIDVKLPVDIDELERINYLVWNSCKAIARVHVSMSTSTSALTIGFRVDKEEQG